MMNFIVACIAADWQSDGTKRIYWDGNRWSWKDTVRGRTYEEYVLTKNPQDSSSSHE